MRVPEAFLGSPGKGLGVATLENSAGVGQHCRKGSIGCCDGFIFLFVFFLISIIIVMIITHSLQLFCASLTILHSVDPFPYPGQT